ncbi:ATP-binding protein (plasmid) [Streptomyces sp. NBC_00445]|uniref:ATP-binding protein n=1 Tax=Streptomyces sp. NBC_00445 TaxID=2975745 RepID=UPI002E1C19FF
MTFPADPCRAQQVRQVIGTHLRCWRRSSLSDAVLLATTEAFANAVRHGSRSPRDRITVAMENSNEQLCVAISDQTPGQLPIVQSGTDLLAECGRGLALIEAVTDLWGVRPADEGLGKTVWLVFHTSAETEEPPPASNEPSSPQQAVSEKEPMPRLSYEEGRRQA